MSYCHACQAFRCRHITKRRNNKPQGAQHVNKSRLPAEWEIIDDIAIIDPDGWDRRNYIESWNTPIDYEEWKTRMFRSTIAAGLRQWKKVDEEVAARVLAEADNA